jgi:ATP phosphoribosyltransferase
MGLRIVVPDGSMEEPIKNLFTQAGIPITILSQRTKQGSTQVDWIEKLMFQRPQEIPLYLEAGHFDLAIVGQDWLANWDVNYEPLLKLPLARQSDNPVKIVLAVSALSGYSSIKDLPPGCTVATEYVELVERLFIQDKYERDDLIILPSYGNTEHKIQFGATAIVEVTETGTSLEENGLKIIETLMESFTVVVANPNSYYQAEGKRPYIDLLVKLLRGAMQARKFIRIEANVPETRIEEASKIMGGLKGPTISRLSVPGWLSMVSYVPRATEQNVIFELLQLDVTDIAVLRDVPLIMSD